MTIAVLIKLVGCLLILVSTSGYGYFRGMEYKKHVEEIGRLKQVIWKLRGEMKYTQMTLDALSLKLQKQVEEPYASWFAALHRNIEKKGQKELGKLWEEETRSCLRGLNLSLKELTELGQLGYQLNHLDIRMQEQTLCWYEEQLEEKRKNLSEKIEERRRLSCCLGVMSGIFLIILLL